jgi:hypothetical protein
MHSSALISNLPSPSLIAPTGHSDVQAPQLTQSSEITYAIASPSFNIDIDILIQLDQDYK